MNERIFGEFLDFEACKTQKKTAESIDKMQIT